MHFPLKLLQSKQKQSITRSHLYVFLLPFFFNVFKPFRIPISSKIRSLPSHLLQTLISAHFRASLYFIITQPFKRIFLLPCFFQCVSAFLNTYFFKIRSLPSDLLHISISAHFRATLYFIQSFKCVFLQPFFLSMHLSRFLIPASFQNNNASKPFLRISITHSNFIVNEFKFFSELFRFFWFVVLF